MNASHETVLITLTEKIEVLKRQVSVLEKALERSNARLPEELMGWLRLRGAVLLYLGDKPLIALEDSIIETFGTKDGNSILRHMSDLHRAPFPLDAQNKIRASFDHGMTRW